MRLTLCLAVLTLVLPLNIAAQAPTGAPSPMTDPASATPVKPGIAEPPPVAPVKPGVAKPVPAPQSNTPAPTAVPAALLRRIAVVDLPGRPGFQSVAITNGALVMAHPADATVDIFSLLKRRLVQQISGMKGANGVAVDNQAGKLYVANTDADEIAVISTANWQVERRIPLKVAPTQLLLDSQHQALYVTNWRDLSLSRVDLKDNTVNTVLTGGRPVSLALDPAGRMLYASLEDQRQVIVLDSALNVAKRFPLLASEPTGLVFDTRNHRLYVAARYAVLSLDADSGQELNRVAAPAGMDTLWLDPASGILYGAAEGGSVLVMNTRGRLAVEREFSTDVKGHTIAFDPAKSMLFLPGGRDGRSKLLILRHVKADQMPSPEVAAR